MGIPNATGSPRARDADQAVSAPSSRGWKIAAGVAGAGLAGAAMFNWRRSTEAERKNPPVGQFLTTDGINLHYIDRGQGTPILLLHGNGAMVEDWEASGVIDGLAGDHRVLAFDRPGFGHTVRTRTRIWSPGAQADLFARAMRELGVGKAVVVGHSWGVLPALGLALDHPELVAELVLISGIYYPELRSDIVTSLPSSLPGIGDLLCHTLTPLAAAATGPMQTKTGFAPAPVAKSFQDFPMEMSLRPSQMRTQVKETVMLPVVTAALSRRYGELALPVTIVTGAGDEIIKPEAQSERLHQALDGSRYVSLPGVGHMANYTALEAVLAEIKGAAARSSQAV